MPTVKKNKSTSQGLPENGIFKVRIYLFAAFVALTVINAIKRKVKTPTMALQCSFEAGIETCSKQKTLVT
jgi:hypothetical protein